MIRQMKFDVDTPPSLHHSYVLRIWRSDARQPWRASLHVVASDHLVHFPDLDSAFAFLLRHVESGDEPPDRVDRDGLTDSSLE
jgi:hypothetical protein